ncbi:unnamed protein product [Penicillium salamii]|uniref:Uncharacterized protein n=1 Tax=Penicillium salamii TaxID=1612424 RepID=A0A9W4NJQ8_9EURO|nr:unnamed protein product [Penicillium salamii]CAG7968229.1 unnamed protein product [Penicillium salamii]CAG8081749.1 unnamed protein product [Penicillium salamii]CAG8085228.1 unnamed protein product [Penicillium salamii]CAG8241553.1 unnamed protein product [Penicillium salamii]
MAPSNSRSRSTRPMRSSRTKVKTYHEETSSDDSDNVPRSERASLSLRSRSATRMPRSYREESTDASFDEPVEDQELEPPAATEVEEQAVPPESITTPRPPRQPRPRRTTTPKPKQTKRPSKSRSQVGKPLHKRAKVDEDFGIVLGSGVIPPWQTLPYHILLDIFLRASYPLLDEGRSDRNDSVKWLLGMALLCRSFQEPALAALFQCPPLLPAHKTHALFNLLSLPPDSLSMNYSSKIKNLHLEVEPLLVYKSGPTLGYFDLAKLIEKIPQVQTVRLYHKDDYTVGIPPWHIVPSRWTYPESVFSAIKDTGIHLRSWDWNSRFLEVEKLLELMIAKHVEPAFQGLRELKLLHLNDNQREELSENGTLLASALNVLPNIQRLEFLESSLVSGEVLTHLPHTLRSLTLRNCDRMWSDDLTAFLVSHGTNLQELNLGHNRHLSMSFIQCLGQSCPNLKMFKMDVSMHDGSSYHDVEPHFESLLVKTQIPTWPTSLQEIELTQLRKWDDATAEVFFTSLVNAAPNLRDLRKLGISAILKIGWRDRATFRERWISRLEKVFLRHSPPPDPNLRSLRKRQLNASNPTSAVGVADEGQAGASQPADGGPSTSAKRQSTRLAQQSSVEASEIASSQFRENSPLDAGDIQGMCDVVNIRIDNQRPTEMQYNENDFLDDELSGDEDWNGDDIEPAPGHAW